MRNGECPKCGSHEIYTSNEEGDGFGGDNSCMLSCGARFTEKWQTFLCVNCGYYENYLTDKELIADIISKRKKMDGWKKIST